jgi:flagellin-like protein
MRKAKVVWHKDDDAVSPVIGTILMVAITVVLAAVLWLMVSGMITDTDEQKTTVNMASPDVQSATNDGVDNIPGNADDETIFDAVLDINKITPKDDKVNWADVRIIIKASGGSVLISESVLLADAAYDRTTDPQPIEFWYVETGGDVKMSAGDSIKITGMDTTYEGAQVILKKSGDQISSITLPTDFA